MDDPLRNVIRQRNVALSNMRVYALDHPTTAVAIQRSYDTIKGVLKNKGQLAIGVVDGTLIVDESPVDQSDSLVAKFTEELKLRGMDSLVFYPHVSPDEFKTCLTCMNCDPGYLAAQGGGQKFFEKHGVSHMVVNEVKYGKIHESVGAGEGLEEAIVAAFLMGNTRVFRGNQREFLSLMGDDPAQVGEMINRGLIRMAEEGRGETDIARAAARAVDQVGEILEKHLGTPGTYLKTMSQILLHTAARAVLTLSKSGHLLRLIEHSDALVSQDITDHVIAALGREDDTHRSLALTLLKLLNRAVLKSILFALEREDNVDIRRRLMVVVKSMGPEIAGEIVHRLADSRWFVVRTALFVLGEIGQKSVSPDLLISSVYHDDIRVRKEAIRALGKLRRRSAIKILCGLLKDRDEEIRLFTLKTLGDARDSRAVPHILPLIQKKKIKASKPSLIRQAAIEVLGKIGDPEAIPAMLDLLRSRGVLGKGGETIRKTLVEALGAMRHPELEDVLASLVEKDPDVAVREAARRALLNLRPPEGRPALQLAF